MRYFFVALCSFPLEKRQLRRENLRCCFSCLEAMLAFRWQCIDGLAYVVMKWYGMRYHCLNQLAPISQFIGSNSAQNGMHWTDDSMTILTEKTELFCNIVDDSSIGRKIPPINSPFGMIAFLLLLFSCEKGNYPKLPTLQIWIQNVTDMKYGRSDRAFLPCSVVRAESYCPFCGCCHGYRGCDEAFCVVLVEERDHELLGVGGGMGYKR